MLKDHPVVVLVGARQTGKTTLVQHLPDAARRSYLSLDDLDTLERAREVPDELLQGTQRLTIDEVQRAPNLLLAIKRQVDRARRRGRFLLTGSANLLLMRDVSESLAGRAVYLQLGPFTAAEKKGQGTRAPWSLVLRARNPSELAEQLKDSKPASQWRQEAIVGGMPRSFLARTSRERISWFEGYIQTYLERDLRDIAQITALRDYRKVMMLACHRIGQLLNQTGIGRDAGVAQATAHRYLNLLETTFQTERVPAFSGNLSKRLIKSPKLYWTDCGVAAHLAGISSVAQLRGHRLEGALLENLVLTGLLTWRETTLPRPEITYLRTTGGAEVDFIVEDRSHIVPVEVKAAQRARRADTRHLESFLEDVPRARFGVLLHDSPSISLLSPRIIALPVGLFI